MRKKTKPSNKQSCYVIRVDNPKGCYFKYSYLEGRKLVKKDHKLTERQKKLVGKAPNGKRYMYYGDSHLREARVFETKRKARYVINRLLMPISIFRQHNPHIVSVEQAEADKEQEYKERKEKEREKARKKRVRDCVAVIKYHHPNAKIELNPKT